MGSRTRRLRYHDVLTRCTQPAKIYPAWQSIPGIAVQPDNILAQTGGSIIYRMGLTLTERITVHDGEIQQSNFYGYAMMRMCDIPDIHVKIISTDNNPTGAGQMATPLVAPAISNAIVKSTGTRLRHMPFLPERVLAAMKSPSGPI
jgi:isoquinoline 1-oxidoreductase subunit beta